MIEVQSVQVPLSEMMDNPGRNLQRFQEELNGAVYKGHTLTHVVAQNLLTQERRRITSYKWSQISFSTFLRTVDVTLILLCIQWVDWIEVAREE